jgi:hypothetical protein
MDFFWKDGKERKKKKRLDFWTVMEVLSNPLRYVLRYTGI